MTNIFALFILMVSHISVGAEILTLNLSKNEKLEGSFSIVNNKYETTHLLFIKNSETKKYIIKPFLISEKNVASEMQNVIVEKKPNIIANFSDKKYMTISSYDDADKTLTLIEFDLATGKVKYTEILKYQKPDIIFNQNNQILFLKFIDSGKKISLDIITNELKISSKTYIPSEGIYKELKSLSRNIPEAVNQNEYVENGSIKDERAYADDNYFYLTKENNNKTTTVVTFAINDTNNIKSATIDFELGKESKDHNTYLFDRKLISVNTSYDNIELKNYDLVANSITKKFTLNGDLKLLFDKSNIDKFLKQEKMTKLKVTTTINKLKNNKNKITISRVNINNYSYNYNWWWFHTFMMQQMQMQQMMNSMSRPRGFGPNDSSIEEDLFLIKEEKYKSLEFIVDSNFTLEKDVNAEPVYKNIDKVTLLEPFEKDKNIKNFTAAFLDNQLRYIYQDNKSKTIYIESKTF